MTGSATIFAAGLGKEEALVPGTCAVDYFPCMRQPLMVTLCRLLRETYEPEQLTPSSTLEADLQGNAVLEVIIWMVFVPEYRRWPRVSVLVRV